MERNRSKLQKSTRRETAYMEAVAEQIDAPGGLAFVQTFQDMWFQICVACTGPTHCLTKNGPSYPLAGPKSKAEGRKTCMWTGERAVMWRCWSWEMESTFWTWNGSERMLCKGAFGNRMVIWCFRAVVVYMYLHAGKLFGSSYDWGQCL